MPRRYSPAEAIKILRAMGFMEVGQRGDHKQFKMAVKGSGKVTLRMKKGEISPENLTSMIKQAGTTRAELDRIAERIL